MQRPPAVPLARANSAMAAARRYRAEWLLMLADDMIGTLDLINQAATEQGIPLRKLTLFQILTARPGKGTTTARAALDQLRIICDRPDIASPDMTVGWLIDTRLWGKRFIAWLGAVEVGRHGPPWPGFPFTPNPLPNGGRRTLPHIAPQHRRRTSQ